MAHYSLQESGHNFTETWLRLIRFSPIPLVLTALYSPGLKATASRLPYVELFRGVSRALNDLQRVLCSSTTILLASLFFATMPVLRFSQVNNLSTTWSCEDVALIFPVSQILRLCFTLYFSHRRCLIVRLCVLCVS